MTDEYLRRLSHDDYLTACRAWADGRLAAWAQLWDLLDDRPGWHAEVDESGPLWRFGIAGAARLVVTIDNQYFVVFEHRSDAEKHLFDIPSVLLWIEKQEPANAGLTPLQEEIIEEFLPKQAEDWLRGQDDDDGK